MLGSSGVIPAEKPIVARVGNVTISATAFNAAYERERRQRFYHGAPPAEEMQSFRQEVTESLIMRVLLLQEAQRRGLQADADNVRAALKQVEQHYGQNLNWQRDREQLLPQLRQQYTENDLVQQLETLIRRTTNPSDDQLKDYFQTHREKFTEPARDRLSLIMLSVAPSSSATVWDAARAEARTLIKHLHNGGDFAELARLHSADATAQNGGDMGYLHNGMLNAQTEQIIQDLSVGEITDPVSVLEGIAIFRLEERQLPVQHNFDQVHTRVRALWLRDQSEQAWQTLRQQLRAAAAIEIM